MDHSEDVLDMNVIAALRELGGDGDETLFHELLDLYVDDSTKQLQRLAESLEQGDLRVAERIAHTLKSSSAHLGASAVSKLCLEMEQHGREQRAMEMRALLDVAREAHRRAVAALVALRQ
ncbi:MAG: Hpt domain-containing protein [Planctomycetes bacterium]|nr:Hpt domain-containing protein [Planctomycetota bacterium]